MVNTHPMTRLSDLWQLQETDSALDTRRASLADAEARLCETDELIAARARAEELRIALRAAESTQKDVDLEAGELRAKIAPQEAKLYSGTIKNPKELAGLQADIDQLKRHLAMVEDRDLEAIATVEAADAEHRAAVAELAVIETAWREEQAELADRVKRLAVEITEYEDQRRDRTEYVDDAELIKMYDRLRVAHQGRAMAKLDRNLCLGCRISLPLNLVNRARAGSALVQCPNCERILLA